MPSATPLPEKSAKVVIFRMLLKKLSLRKNKENEKKASEFNASDFLAFLQIFLGDKPKLNGTLAPEKKPTSWQMITL
jgi:hypothetical protein